MADPLSPSRRAQGAGRVHVAFPTKTSQPDENRVDNDCDIDDSSSQSLVRTQLPKSPLQSQTSQMEVDRELFRSSSSNQDAAYGRSLCSQVQNSQVCLPYSQQDGSQADLFSQSQTHPDTYLLKPQTPSRPPWFCDYSKSIVGHWRLMEQSQQQMSPLFPNLCEITKKDRAGIAELMVTACVKLQLPSKALFNSMKLFDHFLASGSVKRTSMWITAFSCLSLSAKLESSVFLPPSTDYPVLVNNVFNVDELIEKELQIMQELKLTLSYTTSIQFLRFWLSSMNSDEQLEYTTIFVATCTLLSDELTLVGSELLASSILLTALCAVRKSNKVQPISQAIENFGKQRINECTEKVADCVRSVVSDKESPIFLLFEKEERCCVATKLQYLPNLLE